MALVASLSRQPAMELSLSGPVRLSPFPSGSRSVIFQICATWETSPNWTGLSCRLWILSAAAARARILVWLERGPVCPAPAPAFLWNRFGLLQR